MWRVRHSRMCRRKCGRSLTTQRRGCCGRANQVRRQDYLAAQVLIESTGGKGVAPSKILAAEIEGGARRQKRFERALQAKGMMPGGYVAVPAAGAPSTATAISRAPSGQAPVLLPGVRRAGLQGQHGGQANAWYPQGQGIDEGIQDLYGRGLLHFEGAGQEPSSAAGNLRENRHARGGCHAHHYVRPQATYQPRLDFEGVVRKSVEQNFPARMRARLAEAQRTAR